MVIYQNGSPVHLQARLRQKSSGGTDTDGKHHQFALKGAHIGADTRRLLIPQHLLQSGRGDNADPFGLQPAADIGGHLRVKQIGHDLIRHIHNRDFQPFGQQVFRNLQPDKSAAHHHGAAAVVIFHIGPKADGVIGGAHGEYARQTDARHLRYKGDGACGDNQLVIGNGFTVGETDIFGGCVYDHGLHLRPDFHTGQSGILFRRIDNQFLPGLDTPAHIVGQAAARIGDVLTLGIDCDLCAAVLTHQLCGSFRACGNASDNNDIHDICSFIFYCGTVILYKSYVPNTLIPCASAHFLFIKVKFIVPSRLRGSKC